MLRFGNCFFEFDGVYSLVLNNYYITFITFNIIFSQFSQSSLCFHFSICERNIYMIEDVNIILDKDKLVVSSNDCHPVINDCSLGRYRLK